MANKKLFQSKKTAKSKTATLPVVNTVNKAGGVAFQMSDKHALAQMAATGCFGSTFYISEEEQLKKVKELSNKVSPEFLAKVAVYSRTKGFMKDMPAYLAAVLANKDATLLRQVFDKVVDDGKMVRNFVQIIRSGATGRKSLGTVPKKLINKWLAKTKDEALFRASIGNDPSLADVIKLTHPSPENDRRAALYGYITGKEAVADGKPAKQEIVRNGKSVVIHRYNSELLPKVIKDFEKFKTNGKGEVPDVDFRFLSSLTLGKTEWVEIAKNANWHTTRMNLNTFQRHGVFEVEGMAELIAAKLADPEVIAKVKVFPYQLLAAFKHVDAGIPAVITNALQDAMEHATKNIPEIDGKVYIFPDVSGSMSQGAVTGNRAVSSKIRPIDVAGLVAASVLRKNPTAEVLPFEESVVEPSRLRLNARDSVMTNAQKLSSIGGGGTNCSAPLAHLNSKNAKGDLCIFISDNESWVDSGVRGAGTYGYDFGYGRGGRSTQTMVEWNKFKARNPAARLVCIDLTPNTSMQALDREDILNIGGFSDNVFEVISLFGKNGLGTAWTDVIESIKLTD